MAVGANEDEVGVLCDRGPTSGCWKRVGTAAHLIYSTVKRSLAVDTRVGRVTVGIQARVKRDHVLALLFANWGCLKARRVALP